MCFILGQQMLGFIFYWLISTRLKEYSNQTANWIQPQIMHFCFDACGPMALNPDHILNIFHSSEFKVYQYMECDHVIMIDDKD